MITINGKKMGKSYGNQIMLSQMFAGTHPILEQAYSPMTIRFFILQTHYRSTLDFSNEALQASERGLRRLWEAYENLTKIVLAFGEINIHGADKELVERVTNTVAQFDEYMNDDFNTAKVVANMFELVPVINSLKDKHISIESIGTDTLKSIKNAFTTYLENVFGMKSEGEKEGGKLNGVLDLLIDIRKDARNKKDFATSDKIRNQLQKLGVLLKDGKDGGVSYSFE